MLDKYPSYRGPRWPYTYEYLHSLSRIDLEILAMEHKLLNPEGYTNHRLVQVIKNCYTEQAKDLHSRFVLKFRNKKE